MSLALARLSKTYAGRHGHPVQAVKHLDLDVGDGEIVALLGSSGCGKTSTLRMIAGFESVTEGSITLGGRRVDTLPPDKRRVAMAFEGYALYPPLTIAENIGFGLARGIGRDAAAKRVIEVADMLEIAPILARHPAGLSGGQQQRASLARALARDAELHLLDEPMGQLEPQLRSVLRGRVKAALKSRGLTSVLVTHDQTEANAMADRIAVMEGGMLQQYGGAAELRDSPANLYVATFLGEPPMNAFAATVRPGGLALADAPGADLPLAGVPLPAAGEKIVLGVRPHRIRLGEGALAGSVISNQWLGDQAHVVLEFSDMIVVAVAHQRVAVRVGERVPFGVAPADAHIFDASTGRALAHRDARRMTEVLLALDSGTSVVKAVAFSATGDILATASRPNRYAILPDGGAEQDMRRSWDDAAAVLADLTAQLHAAHPGAEILALGVTGQGDGTWLIDAEGAPVGDGWLWLDARAGDLVEELKASGAASAVFACTGTGLVACQQGAQLAWMHRHRPEALARAATAMHPKDYLYFRLTGARHTSPCEGNFTFGDYRTRSYRSEVLQALGLTEHRRLLPPMLDGTLQSHPLSEAAAARTGLRAGLPVSLGYVDVLCTALGAGLYGAGENAGVSVIGSTGMHIRLVPRVADVAPSADGTGYCMPFPVPGHTIQAQTNMAATLNIDWLADIVADAAMLAGQQMPREKLLRGLGDLALTGRPGAAIFHPFISTAGERGPFTDANARASLFGLDQTVRLPDLARAVFEGLSFAARDCYEAIGGAPADIRVTGGAARSPAIRALLAAAIDRPVRVAAQPEAGAAGAAMIAAVCIGVFADMAACAAAWVAPRLEAPLLPDPALVATYRKLFPLYRDTYAALPPLWRRLRATRENNVR